MYPLTDGPEGQTPLVLKYPEISLFMHTFILNLSCKSGLPQALSEILMSRLYPNPVKSLFFFFTIPHMSPVGGGPLMEQHIFCPLFSDSFISALGLSKVSSSFDVVFIRGVSSVSGPLLLYRPGHALWSSSKTCAFIYSEIQCWWICHPTGEWVSGWMDGWIDVGMEAWMDG